MSYCKNCGSTIGDFDSVCSTCGSHVPNAASEPLQVRRTSQPLASDSGPVVSSWGFVGATLLLGVPVVGFLVAVVWAFGAVRNPNLRNFARSYLLLFALFASVALGLVLMALARFGSVLYALNHIIGLFR